MTDQTRNLSFIDVLNSVGSIASITGISLLWLKGDGGIDWINALVIAISVSACVGVTSALVWAFIIGYRKLGAKGSIFVRIAFIGLGGPSLFLLGVLLALVVNKFFLLINWNWFFHR